MEFKVGDRVWTLDPPINLEKSDPEEKGPGRVLEVNPRPFDGAYLVKLDSGKEWAYWESSLRPLLATPTPSITVGTQVRLTGVVNGPTRKSDGAIGVRVNVSTGDEDYRFVLAMPNDLEVIRQPFKRGEVVYCKIAATDETPFVVLNDESLGFVDVTNCETGFHIPNDSAEAYERRP